MIFISEKSLDKSGVEGFDKIDLWLGAIVNLTMPLDLVSLVDMESLPESCEIFDLSLQYHQSLQWQPSTSRCKA